MGLVVGLKGTVIRMALRANGWQDINEKSLNLGQAGGHFALQLTQPLRALIHSLRP